MLHLSCIGYLGSDAKVQNSNGRDFLSFDVSDTDRYVDSNGNQVERVTWVSCAMSRFTEPMAKALTKGTLVFVSGRPSLRVYSSKKDRCMKAGVNLSVDRLEFVGGKVDRYPRQVIAPDGFIGDVLTFHTVSKEFFDHVSALSDFNGLVHTERFGSYLLSSTGILSETSVEPQSDAGPTPSES